MSAAQVSIETFKKEWTEELKQREHARALALPGIIELDGDAQEAAAKALVTKTVDTCSAHIRFVTSPSLSKIDIDNKWIMPPHVLLWWDEL